MTYLELRDQTRQDYLRQHAWFGVPSWWPLQGREQFEQIHTLAMQAIAERTDANWVRSYSAMGTDATDIFDFVLNAVLTALLPGIGPLVSPFVEMGIKFVIQLLLSAIQQQFQTPTSGSNGPGASPAEYLVQIKAWANEAAQPKK